MAALVQKRPVQDIIKPKPEILQTLAGAKADPAKKSLLDIVTKRIDLTAAIGTELHGVQLSKLTEQQRQELALLVSERGVVFFREQDITLEEQVALGESWGPLHVHPIGKKDESRSDAQFFQTNEKAKVHAGEDWHTDISFEEIPSAYAILKLNKVPPVGGDTLWVSTYAAYDKLSPSFRKSIEGLTAYHNAESFLRVKDSGYGDDKAFLRDGREDVADYVEHPVVRTHPVTGWKALYVNQTFTKHIKGWSKPESNALLKFLYKHIATSDDIKVRFRWENNSVAIWDNRVTQHYAVWDYFPYTRDAQRVVVLGERPYYDSESVSQVESGKAQYEVPPLWRRTIVD